ncbi:MAG TPA: DUF2088 domain-containing protein [bacterium]|nr:DUF2088 domain-containing protein [bacterium]
MLLYAKGSVNTNLSYDDLRSGLFQALNKLGPRKKVLAIPPDYTRVYSFAGTLTQMIWNYYGESLSDILPALGTHSPMSQGQIDQMFGEIPKSLFRVHDWRNDIVTLGNVSVDFVKKISNGAVEYSWPAQVNSLIAAGGHDLILSIGQVVPHEVIGMANYNKNIFVGTGGAEGIHKSHFLSAVIGIEQIMGRAINPVRQLMNFAADHFATHLPIIYILTVVEKNNRGGLAIRGLYIGDDVECFEQAAGLSLQVNVTMLNEPLEKVVVYLDPAEYKSCWLGNKSIYRTRMAIADGGELIVLAPGVKAFGEDPEIDRLIRKYGYRTTAEILQLIRDNEDLKNNLCVAAHLIHGSSENRFTITYCPGFLTKTEIEDVNFNYAELNTMLEKYDPQFLTEGYNLMQDGEEIFYISNPALGLWVFKDRFKQTDI